MNNIGTRTLSLLRWATLLSGLALVGFAGFHFFDASAQTEAIDRSSPERILVNGRLVYVRQAFGGAPDSRIIHSNPDGSSPTQLPVSASLTPQYPAWSPDGTKIAYTIIQTPNDIWSINADGSGATNLTNTGSAVSESYPTWSVSGKIAYNREGQIWTMNSDGSGQAQFTTMSGGAAFSVWSPDGSKLAFVNDNDIWVINSDGTNQRRVTNNTTTDSDPDWSPDGTKIIFTKSTSGLSVVSVDTGSETPITTVLSDKMPAWSPDGTQIAFARGGASDGGIYTMNVDGSDPIKVLSNSTAFPLCCDQVYQHPSWQPLAQTPNTLIIRGRVAYNGAGVAGATVNLSGATTASTTTDLVGNYQFSGLAPGGNYTVSPSKLNHYFTPPSRTFNNLSANQVGNFEVLGVCLSGRCVKNGKIAFMRNGEIYTIGSDGTEQTNITNNAAQDGEPNWSPDGSKIAFSSGRDGDFEIYRMDANGANQIRITNNNTNDFSPYYSPDGSSIVFVATRDGNNEIYKMNADGSNQVRLTNDAGDQNGPAFSPDGNKIVYVRSTPPARLWVMNSDGSDQHELSTFGGTAPAFDRPSFSPDGSKVIFTYTPDASTQIRVNYTMNSNGTGAARFPADGRNGSYSPDGSKVVYNCCQFDNTNRLRISNFDGTGVTGSWAATAPVDTSDWQQFLLPRTPFDFDGDGKSDQAIFRPSTTDWWHLSSIDNVQRASGWGMATDVLAPADYDGDRKTDHAVWRPSTGNFHVLNSFDNTVRIENFGLSGDVPTGGDFDGDGKADLAVYRPGGAQGTFYYRASMGNPQGNIAFVPWGVPGDKPVVADYDGDGRSDAAVYRPSNGTWYVNKSSNGQLFAINFGLANDKLVPADYDADGKTDFAVFRGGIWYLLQSSKGFAAFQFGLAGDTPVPADYDGDGRTDAAIFRDGVWWMLKSGSGAEAVQFGFGSDGPIQAAFVR